MSDYIAELIRELKIVDQFDLAELFCLHNCGEKKREAVARELHKRGIKLICSSRAMIVRPREKHNQLCSELEIEIAKNTRRPTDLVGSALWALIKRRKQESEQA